MAVIRGCDEILGKRGAGGGCVSAICFSLVWCGVLYDLTVRRGSKTEPAPPDTHGVQYKGLRVSELYGGGVLFLSHRPPWSKLYGMKKRAQQ